MTKQEIAAIYHRPLLDLVYEAATVHRNNNNYSEVQISSLVSIKTGGCSEDCAYCPQAARYHTGVSVHALMQVDEVVELARKAKSGGASRLCMGAAWREVRNNRDFDRVLEMVTAVNDLDMEVCCTLGMLTQEQAIKLKQAGLYAYNHNLDTSEENYSNIITTRTYADRLQTLQHVRDANITVCSGGIIGLGETEEDRLMMLCELAQLDPPPESVPINCLMPQRGTPLAMAPPVDSLELVRLIATARIAFPRSRVRLSAGRDRMSRELQVLCFLAGADSVFFGEKLLTAPNPHECQDEELFKSMGVLAT